ncbi:MAG: tetratricopeptide repeat protein [Verrucomicrobiae bacterium]|nr:tetratricopeptide repeat protein [Verrucomicrobiae bacterium]
MKPTSIPAVICLSILTCLPACLPGGVGVAARAAEMDLLREPLSAEVAEPSALPEIIAELATAALREAYARVQQGDFDGALSAARRAASADPRSAPAAELVGVALAKRGELDDALRWFQRAVEIDARQGTAWTKIGDVQLSRQDGEAARAAYIRALEVNPSDRRAHQRLGLLLEQDGDVAGAIRHFERGLVGTPADYVGIKVNLGRLYNQVRAYDRAVALLAPVVPAGYPSATAHLVLGTAYLAMGRNAEAIAAFERMREVEPGTAVSELALSMAHQRSGEWRRALETVEGLIRRQPELGDAYVQRAEIRLSMGQTNQAMADLTKAIETSARPVGVRHRLAEVWLAQDRQEEAIAIYRAMVTDGSAVPGTYDRLALLHQVRGEIGLAEEAIEAGCRAFPRSGLLRLRQGLLYGFIQRYDRCRDALLEAERLSPGDPRVGKALAGAYLRLGDRTEAVRWARRVVEMAPESVDDRFFLGGLLEEQGELEGAIREYRWILERQPRHVAALNNLASALAAAGRMEEALGPAGEAVSLAPGSATVLDTHGWIQFRLGRYAEARQTLERAAGLADVRPVHRYHLGLARWKAGDRVGAIEALEQALADGTAFRGRDDAERVLGSLR